MISKALFVREMKTNGKILLIFLAVLTMYATVIISMYDPSLGKTLTEMANSMPGLFAAFGMLDAGKTLLEFTSNYLYGFLLVCFPAVFLIILGNRLIGRYVDKGSMACILATPTSRSKVAFTQSFVMIISSLIMVLYVTLVVILSAVMMFPGDMDIAKFIILNVGLFGLLVFMGGLCFCASTMFNEVKYTYGVSAGLIIAFVLIQMLSEVGDKFEWLSYCTPLTLFDPKAIIKGDSQSTINWIILYVAGIALYLAGVQIFRKRDLSL